MKNGFRIASALLSCAALPFIVGCACNKCERTASLGCGEAKTVAYKSPCKTPCATVVKETKVDKCGLTGSDLPPNAVPGECYAKVFIPPQYNTVTERVCVKEASERLEIVPAQYEWVEERVCVKDATTELRETPCQFETREQVVEVERPYTTWEMNKSDRCRTDSGQPVRDVFCLVNHAAVTKTIRTEHCVKPATCEKITIPAEYETIRRQKLVSAAATRRITIPAEYDEVQKTLLVCAGHMEWQRVVCEASANAETANAVKLALATKGFDAGPLNGEIDRPCLAAIEHFQQESGLGVGYLTYQTMEKLGVSVK